MIHLFIFKKQKSLKIIIVDKKNIYFSGLNQNYYEASI